MIEFTRDVRNRWTRNEFYAAGSTAANLPAAYEAALVGAGLARYKGAQPPANKAAFPATDKALPPGFPAADLLRAAGLTTLAAVRACPDLTAVKGVGRATAEKIREALA